MPRLSTSAVSATSTAGASPAPLSRSVWSPERRRALLDAKRDASLSECFGDELHGEREGGVEDGRSILAALLANDEDGYRSIGAAESEPRCDVEVAQEVHEGRLHAPAQELRAVPRDPLSYPHRLVMREATLEQVGVGVGDACGHAEGHLADDPIKCFDKVYKSINKTM